MPTTTVRALHPGDAADGTLAASGPPVRLELALPAHVHERLATAATCDGDYDGNVVDYCLDVLWDHARAVALAPSPVAPRRARVRGADARVTGAGGRTVAAMKTGTGSVPPGTSTRSHAASPSKSPVC